jgi:ABC-type thiamin/hydroxymethylpyrimidine transport system permease subunit
MAAICPSCAERMVAANLKSVNLKQMSAAALEGLWFLHAAVKTWQWSGPNPMAATVMLCLAAAAKALTT